MADYTARVARITGQPIVLPQAAPLPYPRARDLHLPLPEVRARLLDLTDFQRCNLTQLIAERNSIMGRGYWPATRGVVGRNLGKRRVRPLLFSRGRAARCRGAGPGQGLCDAGSPRTSVR